MRYQFIGETDGFLKVWQQPEPDMVYTMGIDVSSGLSEDYSVVQVLTNTIPFYQAACFRAKLAVNTVTEWVYKIGKWYNDALAVCEINYPGNSVQDALLQYYQYPRNYQAEQHLHEDPSVSTKYGFRTTETSKWMLIHGLQITLSSREIKINDRETMYEMLNYVYQSGPNKAAAAEGFNDDTVMALMLALHGAKLYPLLRPTVIKPKVTHLATDPDTKRDWRMFQQKLRHRMEHKDEVERKLAL